MKGTAIITGGAKRVGREICLKLGSLGYNIAIHYNNSKYEAQELCKEIGHAEIFQADLADIKSLPKLMEEIFLRFPDTNILVNNASIFKYDGFTELSEELFDEIFNINFKAPYFLTKLFLQNLKQAGNVINMLDSHITKNNTPYIAYLLSKKSLFEFTKISAIHAGKKARVNGICPGIVLPSPDGFGEEYMAAKAQKMPLGKLGDPESIADMVAHIIASDYLTGQVFFINGGEHLI